MNKKHFPFWLRVILFTIVFSIAFSLIIFIAEKNPSFDFKVMLMKVGLLAIASSFVYNVLLDSEAGMAE